MNVFTLLSFGHSTGSFVSGWTLYFLKLSGRKVKSMNKNNELTITINAPARNPVYNTTRLKASSPWEHKTFILNFY